MISYSVVHREADPDSAERLAGLAGTVPGWSYTRKVGGGLWQPREGTKTRGREYVIGPDQFKRLRPDWAVVIQPTAEPPAEIVKVFQARPLAGGEQVARWRSALPLALPVLPPVALPNQIAAKRRKGPCCAALRACGLADISA